MTLLEIILRITKSRESCLHKDFAKWRKKSFLNRFLNSRYLNFVHTKIVAKVRHMQTRLSTYHQGQISLICVTKVQNPSSKKDSNPTRVNGKIESNMTYLQRFSAGWQGSSAFLSSSPKMPSKLFFSRFCCKQIKFATIAPFCAYLTISSRLRCWTKRICLWFQYEQKEATF